MAKKGVKLLVPGEKERMVVSLSEEEKESASGLAAEEHEMEEEEEEKEKKNGEEELTATATAGEICEVRRGCCVRAESYSCSMVPPLQVG